MAKPRDKSLEDQKVEVQSASDNEPKVHDWLFERIDEASKKAGKLYLSYIGFLAYCALTVVSTTHRQMVLKNEPVRLPIVNLDVSLDGFFFLAPLLAMFLFAYFQFYLLKTRDLITNPKIKDVPNSKDRIYPWLINFADDHKDNLLGGIQRFIVFLSLWWSLSLVLMLFSFWYLKKHEPNMSRVVGLMPLLGAIVVILFWTFNESKQKAEKSIFQFKKFISDNGIKIFSAAVVLIYEIILFVLLIPWANGGVKPWLCVDLSYQKLVNEESQEYDTHYWVNLRGVHLEGANLTGAILKKADLRDAILTNANLSSSNLQKARLDGAQLQGADLMEAQLQGANLTGAQLQRAKLYDVRLDSANLREAQLQGAKLEGAYLRGADLSSAKLQGADFGGARLQGIDLSFARLDSAYLGDAQLQGADLSLANLQGAKYLTIEQLSQVKTLEGAQLDSTVYEQVVKNYPQLLTSKIAEKN